MILYWRQIIVMVHQHLSPAIEAADFKNSCGVRLTDDEPAVSYATELPSNGSLLMRTANARGEDAMHARDESGTGLPQALNASSVRYSSRIYSSPYTKIILSSFPHITGAHADKRASQKCPSLG